MLKMGGAAGGQSKGLTGQDPVSDCAQHSRRQLQGSLPSCLRQSPAYDQNEKNKVGKLQKQHDPLFSGKSG